jgi:hypothetical protein
MKTVLRTSLFGVALMLGCSAYNVNTDYDRSADFSKFQTYSYVESDISIKEEFPLAHERILTSIDEQLSSKGMTTADSNPDVFVTFHVEDDERVRVDAANIGYGYGDDWAWGAGMPMGSSTGQVRTYMEGTLVVDIWDAKKKELVWRGVATETLSVDPAKNQKIAQEVIEEMFKRYPPGR